MLVWAPTLEAQEFDQWLKKGSIMNIHEGHAQESTNKPHWAFSEPLVCKTQPLKINNPWIKILASAPEHTAS